MIVDMGKQDLSHFFGKIINWFNHFENHFGNIWEYWRGAYPRFQPWFTGQDGRYNLSTVPTPFHSSMPSRNFLLIGWRVNNMILFWPMGNKWKSPSGAPRKLVYRDNMTRLLYWTFFLIKKICFIQLLLFLSLISDCNMTQCLELL